MDFKSLTDRECGGNNPIINLTQHFVRDKNDLRFLSPSLESSDRLNRSTDQLKGQNRFRMDSLLTEIRSINAPTQISKLPSQQAQEWVQEHCNTFQDPVKLTKSFNDNLANKWADEYLNYASMRPPYQGHSLINQVSLKNQNESKMGQWAQEYLEQAEVDLCRSRQIKANKWTEEFIQSNVVSKLSDDARRFIESMKNDPEISQTEFMNFIQKIADEEIVFDNVKESADIEAESVWQDYAIQNDNEYFDNLSSAWDKNVIDFSHDFESQNSDKSSSYLFTKENPFKELPDPFEEGCKKLDENDIPSAVLMFEAACQKDPSNSLYWQYLGTSQAQNEHDTASITALQKCIDLDPNNLIALMAISVSYTNKGMTKEACENLNLWFTRNPKYSETFESLSRISVPFLEIKEKFIRAARLYPNSPDADLQCGLGVLLNISGEYSKAADCFRAALQAKPHDAILWNRLGATLANGSKSEEAVAAYRHALMLAPGLIRCRFNLGVSCINLGAYREAAEHFLTVLNLQNSGRGMDGYKSSNIMSYNVLTTLKLVLSLMNRHDLYSYVENMDLDKLNEEFGMT